MDNYDLYDFATLAVRAGQDRTHERENSDPLFLTSSFVFESAAQAAACFSGNESGNIYSRFTNPTVRAFEQRLAALEGGESCVATASGMSAILATCLSLLKSGDHIVSSKDIFGTTRAIFNKYLARFGIETTFVPLADLTAWERAIQPNTRLFFLETPSNPLNEIADIAQLAQLSKKYQTLLVVDNCFCTPALQRPLELGADIIIHSATKYLDGQGRCVGGAVVGDKQRVGEEIFGFLRTAGPTLSPFNAWVFLKGLETLTLRMEAHSRQAQAIAEWLEKKPEVARVYYAGLASHPQHQLAAKQQSDFGGLLAFELKGGKAAAWTIIDSVSFISITANLGDTKSIITHPATTTHSRLSQEERESSGIKDGLVRLSVGLESVEDIKKDLQQGFDKL
ncbi:O-succinylhomoserine sulfhydrylase [Candidatus Nitrosacidococcus tergens]|uniref:O-succinylhomoserine sulfhydrylase n=1 Tax=Candidatus Nitrosacidococcus tergens TaxID=553981 RepID=A0A7G1Q9Z8_9GAMM|nr:O-succinylhomoserine sulfhydrylase [Candidatus Nitrosacidococcus tergens]CAB1276110.1 O-succinylhomoserine sulfhydrylase [Candidatus Nitrosacidococcus tergens]